MKKKLISLLLVGAMTGSLLVGCGGKDDGETQSDSTPAGDTGSSEQSSGNSEDGNSEVTYSNEQIIIGDQSEMSGDITPYWTNNAADYNPYKMITGLGTVSVTQEGKWVWDDTVVKEHSEVDNEDGSRTYTITINDGLKWSNGDPVTAKDYVFAIAFFYSDEVTAGLEASEALANMAQYYVGSSAWVNGESDTFEGVHLIDDMKFSVTVDAQWLPYYYGSALVSIAPEYMAGWVPADVTIEETENGVKFSDNFTAEYIGDTVEAYRYNPTACSGAYKFVKYDANAYAYTLERNENYPGDFEGQKANIKTVIYKYVTADTMIDQLKTGAIDVLLQCADGDSIVAGMDLVDGGGFDFCNYPRAGYGMISFKCNQGPTQFESVRHAIAYLLDRNAFAQTFTGGYGIVVNGPYGSQQWMVKENQDIIDGLNAYSYSLESAKKELEEDGWVYNEDGSDYSGTGIRYKKLDDGTYMPCVIEWLSSEQNPVSELLVTSLQQNPDLEAAGIKINQTVVTFPELLEYYYSNAEDNPYQMFNLATGFGNPYDIAYMYEPGSASNINAVPGDEGQELYDLAQAMNFTEEGDDVKYSENWVKFMQKWNEILPEIPLYSNDYHDFYSTKVHDYDQDGYNWDITSAVLYMNVE